MSKTYVLNRETNKIELSFSKDEYKALTTEQAKELKSHFLFAGSRKVWVSRSTNNHYSAIRTAGKLGFEDAGKVGERLSYAEQVERQTERAEQRIERYEGYADNAENRAERLQSEWKEARQDWSFVTQPNINSSRGRAFTNHRQRLLDRYEKGFEEYRKGAYFRDKAETAEQTASKEKYKDKTYLNNRIEECNKRIRELQRCIVQAEERNNEKWLESLLEKTEYEIDKLAFMENCMDELGGVQYNKGNVKPGYHVKIRGHWDEVIKANPKTVLTKVVEGGAKGFVLAHPYAEIQEMKIPDDWQEKKEQTENPFIIGDIVVSSVFAAHNGYFKQGERIEKAFQIIKKTDKSVTIQRIAIVDNIPQANNFISSSNLRRMVGKNSQNVYRVNGDDWYLYKYDQETVTV